MQHLKHKLGHVPDGVFKPAVGFPRGTAQFWRLNSLGALCWPGKGIINKQRD